MVMIDRRSAVRRAVSIFNEHPAVVRVTEPTFNSSDEYVSVNVTFEISLFSEWRKKGESPSGVRRFEEIQFLFSNAYPINPPLALLRTGFGRNFPHMLPRTFNNHPLPCIFDGNLTELLHREGIGAIVDQMYLWLDRAATRTLIDSEQGWEPVRRDTLENSVIADAKFLQDLDDGRGGCKAFLVELLRIAPIVDIDFVKARVLSSPYKVNNKSIPELFEQNEKVHGNGEFYSKTIALVVWSGKHPSSAPFVCDEYLPETVNNMKSLEQRAITYGCGQQLKSSLQHIRSCLSKCTKRRPIKLVVILLARRPYRVIGSQSSVELCSYVIDIRQPRRFAQGAETSVRAAGHLHALSRSLLAQMSGQEVSRDVMKWTLLGAGSLGSKVALHLARAGNGPSIVVDRAYMSPHNAARHALIPSMNCSQSLWAGSKAALLTDAIAGLDQDATPIQEDITKKLCEKQSAKKIVPKGSWALINTTASDAVRAVIGATEFIAARVIDAFLLARGRIGVIMVEGEERNPSLTDLDAAFYAILQQDEQLRSIVFDEDEGMSLQSTGQGCGSMTMVLSDGRISMFAAGIAEYIAERQHSGLPEEHGEILIGSLSECGLGVSWQSWKIAPTKIVHSNGSKPWSVHLHEQALSRMEEEVARHPKVETGGVLLGRMSSIARIAHVVDVIEPPEDSIRKQHEFVLGLKGLTLVLEKYSKRVKGNLYVLGTWHNHLTCEGPSAIDLETASNLSFSRVMPLINLILTPEKVHAFSVER